MFFSTSLLSTGLKAIYDKTFYGNKVFKSGFNFLFRDTFIKNETNFLQFSNKIEREDKSDFM